MEILRKLDRKKKIEYYQTIRTLVVDGVVISSEQNALIGMLEVVEDSCMMNRIIPSDTKLEKQFEEAGLITYSARGSYYATEKFMKNYNKLYEAAAND